MKVAISGASGFVGTHLTTYLEQEGHTVVPLDRADLAPGASVRLANRIASCDAIVNLAGASIDRRWTARYRELLFASRVDTTQRLVAAANATPSIKTFISTSAVGYYPAVGCYDESDPVRGSSFLSRLCAVWEDQARKFRGRCIITRFGVVFAGDGGAFPRLARPARMGVAVIPGSGAQSVSWIALEDLVRAELFLLTHDTLEGVFNLTSPQKLTMRELIEATGAHFRARMVVRVPSWVIRVVMGEAASVVLDGPCVLPKRLLETGFQFEVPFLPDFLRRLQR